MIKSAMHRYFTRSAPSTARARNIGRIKECYSYYERVSNLIEKSDYTDGMYYGDRSLDYEQAQDNQAQYLLDQARVVEGMTVLDVGCGRGRLLRAARERGAHAVGITISEEQVDHCRGQGLDVELRDYQTIADAWAGRFDAIIANGSMEHFVSPAEGLARRASRIYAATFEIFHRIINPRSLSRRLVTTVIHHRARYGERLSLGAVDKLMFSLLAEVYGGWYPLDGQLEHCAAGCFRAIEALDGTEDYLWTSQDAFAGMAAKLIPRSLDEARHIVDYVASIVGAGARAPLFLLNPLLWTWQFMGDPAPVVLRRHTWELVPT